MRAEDSVWRAVLFFGLVSLFADIAYEGARGIAPNYLVYLGASLLVVGLASGIGELLSYAARFTSGALAERRGSYWLLTFLGYATVIAVPLLALAHTWQLALALIVVERLGKGLRAPPRDALLGSLTSAKSGKVFGVHELIDQLGAIAGPLLVAFIMFNSKSFHTAFSLLFVPTALSLASLYAAKLVYPKDKIPKAKPWRISNVPREVLWLTLAASTTFLGFVHPAFVVVEAGVMAGPVAYAIAMAVDAAIAPLFGHLYDLVGKRILFVWFTTSPLVALSLKQPAIAAVFLGLFLGIQESALRAAVSDLAGDLKASSFGVFHSAVGLAYFIGGLMVGWLLDIGAYHSVVMLSLTSAIIGLVMFSKLVREAR